MGRRITALMCLVLSAAVLMTSCSFPSFFSGKGAGQEARQVFEKKLADYNAGIEKSRSPLYWSPKGNYIIFEGYREKKEGEIEYAIVIADTVSHKITWIKDGHLQSQPSWTSDEKMVVLGSDGIFIYSTDTMSIKKISDKGKSPLVSPDNKKIAFSNDGIWLFDIEKYQTKQLTKRKYDSSPMWFSDSKRLFFFRDTGKAFEGGNGNEQLMSILDIGSPDTVSDANTYKKGRFLNSAWLKADEAVHISGVFDSIDQYFTYNMKTNEMAMTGLEKSGEPGNTLNLCKEDGKILKAGNYSIRVYDSSMKKVGSYNITDDAEYNGADLNTEHLLLPGGNIMFLYGKQPDKENEIRESAPMLLSADSGKQYKLADYGRYTSISPSPDSRRFALLEDEQRLLLLNLKGNAENEVKAASGKAGTYSELASMLPSRIGTEWVYSGLAEYGHRVKLDSMKKGKNGETEYYLSGKVFDLSGGVSKSDYNLQIKYVINNQAIRETVIRGKMLPHKVYSMDVLRGPLVEGTNWKQKVKISGIYAELNAAIVVSEVDKTSGDKVIKVEYTVKSPKLPNGEYKEWRVFRESEGMISFENEFDQNITFNYKLHKIN